MFDAQRWCFTTCTLFFMCPRGFYINADGIRGDFKIQPVQDIHVSKLFPARWAINIVKDKTSATSRLEEAEPGFDFSNEEMSKLKLWPGGVIPYYIDDFSFDKVFRDRIRTFLDVTNGVTGLNFLELNTPPDDETSRWVLFINRQGLLACADHPFKNFTNQGVQRIVLGYDCLTTGGELAEVVLSLVGIPPQHNAPDREKHIRIIKKNIMPGKEYLFETVKDNEWLFHDVDYDFSSASHYPLHKYTVNGMATIEPAGNLGVLLGTVGEGNGFSYTDIWKIRMLYNYISKKQQKAINFPKCNKLFNINSNLSSLQPESEDEIEPRKKPNKYLGLPDDVLEPSNSSSVNENHDNQSEKPASESKKPQTNNEESLDQDAEESDDEDTEEPDNSKKNLTVSNIHKDKDDNNPTRLYSNMGGNALLDLSDYQTDEENSREKNKQRRFTKLSW